MERKRCLVKQPWPERAMLIALRSLRGHLRKGVAQIARRVGDGGP